MCTGHEFEWERWRKEWKKKLRLVYWLAYYIVSGTWSGTIYGMTRRRFALYNARATPYHARACFTLHFQRISLFITRRILVLTCVASIFLTQLFVNVIFARYMLMQRWRRRRHCQKFSPNPVPIHAVYRYYPMSVRWESANRWTCEWVGDRARIRSQRPSQKNPELNSGARQENNRWLTILGVHWSNKYPKYT